MKENQIPFNGIPKGRIFIINVGARKGDGLQSLLFENNTFEFVPVKQLEPKKYWDASTYTEIRQFNNPKKWLSDLPLPSKEKFGPLVMVHNDPEFESLTYGSKRSVLQKVTEGDFLFFIVRLVPFINQKFYVGKDETKLALIGFLEVEHIIDSKDHPLFNKETVGNNAHFKRFEHDQKSFEGFIICKGSNNSRRFKTAVIVDQEFVKCVPFQKADAGIPWHLPKLGEGRYAKISSYTRTPRMHINPQTEICRAKRFWKYVWKELNQT